MRVEEVDRIDTYKKWVDDVCMWRKGVEKVGVGNGHSRCCK